LTALKSSCCSECIPCSLTCSPWLMITNLLIWPGPTL
jgi:hypothetical protein